LSQGYSSAPLQLLVVRDQAETPLSVGVSEGIFVGARMCPDRRFTPRRELKHGLGSFLRQVRSDIKKRVLVGCFDIVQPLGRHAVRQQGYVGHVGEQGRLRRRRLLDFDVLRNLDFEHLLANLDNLHRAGLRVALDSPAFGPLIRLVVMIHVAEQQAGVGLVDDQPNVAYSTRNTFITSSPKVIDHLHRDPPLRLGLGERPGGVAVEALPGVLVDLGLQRGLERLVGVVGAEEIGVADEEALLVVVGVDEPAGDAVGPSERTSPLCGWNTSTPLILTWMRPSRRRQDVDVRLAEDHEQVALAGVLQVAGHVQVGVHARLQHRDAAELVELGRVGLVVEGAGDEHVEAGVAGLAGGGDQVRAADGAELGPMKMPARFSCHRRSALDVAALGADDSSPGHGTARRSDPVLLVGLLHAGGLAGFPASCGEVGWSPVRSAGGPAARSGSISSSSSSTASVRWGERLSTVNGPATRTFFLSS
jgi:hypothetical protein